MPQPVLPGTLEMLALHAIARGRAHGFALMERIQRGSHDVLQVEQGALYPALHRLEAQGLVDSSWGTSENNRRAKYYALTPAGERQLAVDVARWQELVSGMQALLSGPAPALVQP